jgi:hypothetical protein
LESDGGGNCKHLSKIDTETETQKTEEKMLVTKKDIISWVAFWGVQQCSTYVPFEMEKVLLLVEKKLKPVFEDAKYGSKSFTRKQLFDLVNGLLNIPELRKWNLTKTEFDKGIDPDAPERENIFGSTSRYDTYKDYNVNDFIDLNALVRNIVISIEKDCIKNSHIV